MESPLQTIERLQQQIRDLEAQLSAAQQAVQDAVPATNHSGTPNSSTIIVPHGWKLVPDDATPEWVANLEALPDWREAVGECIKRFLAAAPAHPAEGVPATAAVAEPDERAAFEAWLRVKPCGAAHDFGWAAWRARAAIAAAHPTQQGMDAPIIQALAAGISIQQWQSSVEILIGSSDLLVRAIASGKETRIELIRRAVSESLAAQAKQGGAA